MPEPPKTKFTAQHRLVLMLGGAALMLFGALGILTYVDFIAVTIVEGPGYDPRLIMLGFCIALLLMGLGAVISALRMKIE